MKLILLVGVLAVVFGQVKPIYGGVKFTIYILTVGFRFSFLSQTLNHENLSPIEVADALTNAIFALEYKFAARLEKEKILLEAQYKEVLAKTSTAEPSPELKKKS